MKSIQHTRLCFRRAALRLLGTACILMLIVSSSAQSNEPRPPSLTLEECIAFALKNQPNIQQAIIDQAIAYRTIQSKLADWYPQVVFNYNIQHYLKKPLITAPLALRNSSTTNVSLTQNVFNSDVLLATKTAGDIRLNARQNLQLTEIDIVVGVSKSFYDVLVSREQLDILSQDVIRLQKSVNDTKLQYEAGTVDITDYKRAGIALNNALAAKKQNEELLKGKMALLKQQMGFNDSNGLVLVYDNKKLKSDIGSTFADSSLYKMRVEYQQLETQLRLLQFNLRYTKWNYLPTVSLFAGYNLVGQNNSFSKIYNEGYPNAIVGLTLSVPVFQGTKRIQATRLAQLGLKRIDGDFLNLKLAINTEYTTALALYKASLNNYAVSNENVKLAQEVYATVQLQYQSGVKTYLDVVIAETDLRTAEVATLGALYLVLSGKLDVQRAAGTITY